METARWATPPSQPDYWQVVARLVPGRTATQCQRRVYENSLKNEKVVDKKAPSLKRKADADDGAPTAITARRGTAAHRSQLRELVNQRIAQTSDDDAFEDPSGPLRNHSARLPRRAAGAANAAIATIAFMSRPQATTTARKKQRTVIEPTSPESNKTMSLAPDTSPEILKPIDHKPLDNYITKVKRSQARQIKVTSREQPQKSITQRLKTSVWSISQAASRVFGSNERTGVQSKDMSDEEEEDGDFDD